MKALSVKNPYANLIRLGFKKYEIRSRYTYHRGDILICVSKSKVYAFDVFNFSSVDIPSETYKYEGMAICVATITDVFEFDKSHEIGAFVKFDSSKPLYAYKLENIREIEPFPVKGNQSFFEVDDSLIKFR